MAAIVLAGGKSRRMKTDKALLPWEGKTLLEHAVSIVSQIEERVIVVADVADKYTVPGVERVVGDMFPGTGPLGGLLTGLEYCGSGYHCLFACDMPFMKPEVFRLLYSMANGHDACIPAINGRLEPLCGVYNQSCGPALREILLKGTDLSLHGALRQLAVEEVGEDRLRSLELDLRSFTNINSLEDYGRINPSG